MDLRSGTSLAIRFLGLALLVLALPGAVAFAHDAIQGLLMYGPGILSPAIDHGNDEVLSRLGPFLQFVLGTHLFLDGRWVIRRVMRGLDGRCARCGYDLEGLGVSRCPECGRSIRAAEREARRGAGPG